MFAYQISHHKAIQSSPFKALYRREPVLSSHVAINLSINPSLSLKDAQEELYSHQLHVSDTLYQTAAKYDKASESQVPLWSYEEGDLVLVYRSWILNSHQN